MNDCRRTVERLAAYADESLAREERDEVERHLSACPPCRASASEERAGRAALRACADRLRTAPLPPGLRSRCEAVARERAQGTARFNWRTRLVPALLTAVLIIVTAAMIFALATRQSAALLAAQLTADHVKCFGDTTPDASALDAADAENALASRYGWNVHVPPSQERDGVRLVGARRCLYAEGRIPHMLYHVNGRDVSLYMLTGVTRKEADVTAFGHRSRIWSRGPNTFVLVSPADAGELESVMAYVRQEAR